MSMFMIAPVKEGSADWARPRLLPPLKPIQIKILSFVHRYQQMWGTTPLYREIGHACGLQSDSAVAYQVRRLQLLGAVRKPPRLHRAMHLTVIPVTGAA
jgi:SOS-response transcriptional repressor LexA